jgi:hypothetical protein
VQATTLKDITDKIEHLEFRIGHIYPRRKLHFLTVFLHRRLWSQPYHKEGDLNSLEKIKRIICKFVSNSLLLLLRTSISKGRNVNNAE